MIALATHRPPLGQARLTGAARLGLPHSDAYSSLRSLVRVEEAVMMKGRRDCTGSRSSTAFRPLSAKRRGAHCLAGIPRPSPSTHRVRCSAAHWCRACRARGDWPGRPANDGEAAPEQRARLPGPSVRSGL